VRLTPKSWAEFQHYKDRSPPWIKLHKKLLDDRVFQRLPDASRALAPMLWLLASESDDGAFNGSTEELAFRLRQTDRWVDAALKPLILAGFFVVVQNASEALAEGLRDACLETEGETEKEAEGEKARKRATPPNPGVDPQVWDDWLALRKAKRAPVTQTVIDGATTEAQKAGMSLESFLRIWCRRGSQGLEAAWLKPEEKAQSFAERATAAKAARLAEMTGGLLGNKPGAKGAVIDMEVPNAPRLTA
jgi:hypothetical protein